MITVTAVQLVVPGREADLQGLMVDLTAQVKANEPGCATFDWLRSSANPQSYLVIEQYVDQPAFKLHQNTTYLKAFIPKLMTCLQQAPAVTIYDDAVMAPPPAPASYFHIGVVVPDLEKAIARYSDVLGIKFTEPATFKIPRLEDPDPHPGTLVAAFSMTEPPYYELIQAAGTGIIAPANAGRILYFAQWESDMAGRLAALKKQKVGVDALFRMDATSPPFAMITAPDLYGARIEYVDASDRPPIEEWVRTGKYPGGIGQQ
jgi:quinol monooxygenase YgiN